MTRRRGFLTGVCLSCPGMVCLSAIEFVSKDEWLRWPGTLVGRRLSSALAVSIRSAHMSLCVSAGRF